MTEWNVGDRVEVRWKRHRMAPSPWRLAVVTAVDRDNLLVSAKLENSETMWAGLARSGNIRRAVGREEGSKS